jgi:hypothetical protein
MYIIAWLPSSDEVNHSHNEMDRTIKYIKEKEKKKKIYTAVLINSSNFS